MFHCFDRPEFTRRHLSGACGHSTNEEKTTATTTANCGGKEERDNYAAGAHIRDKLGESREIVVLNGMNDFLNCFRQ